MSDFTRVDWDHILQYNKEHHSYCVKNIQSFAEGNLSGKDLYSLFAHTSTGGEVRRLLRNHGVTYARRLARKALRRRGVKVSITN